MSEQIARESGTKRNVAELNKPDLQGNTEKTTENQVKKVKSAQEEAGAARQEILLNAGVIYRVRSPELGDFLIRGGSTGGFSVKAATLKIWNTQSTGPTCPLIFPDPSIKLIDAGVEVEVKDNVSGNSALSVLPFRAKPTPQKQNWLSTLSKVILGSHDDSPVQIIGLADKDTIITGGRSAVVSGNGGRLKFSGTGTVTVEGSLQSIQSIGSGNVKVNGKVTEKVEQTGKGTIVITEDVHGSISNTGGGTIEVMGMHKGTDKQLNNTGGTVWIGTGPNNGGVKEHYHTKNYKITQL